MPTGSTTQHKVWQLGAMKQQTASIDTFALLAHRRSTAYVALVLGCIQLACSFSFVTIQNSQSRRSSVTNNNSCTTARASPKEALPDIVVPSIFGFNEEAEKLTEEDPRVWVPQTECLDFRPLCFCVSHGYYVNLLRFRGGGILGCHRHSSPVHALTLKGGWGYKEHNWHASAGTYVFEPPGETHTLLVDEDCEEMIAMFHVTGSLLYIDPEDGKSVTGFDDVFTKLEKAKRWYAECGLGEDYALQFVR